MRNILRAATMYLVASVCLLAQFPGGRGGGGQFPGFGGVQGGQRGGRGQTDQQSNDAVPQNLDPSQLASVSGTVVSDTTQQPIRKAVVRLTHTGTPPMTYEATSDAGGSFHVEGLIPGRYIVSAQRTGFLRSGGGFGGGGGRGGSGGGSSNSINLTAGQTLAGVSVKLTPQAAVSGRIADEDDDALQNAIVQLSRYRYSAGRRQLATLYRGTTNDLGEYRIAEVQPGRYYVTVSAAGNGFGRGAGGPLGRGGGVVNRTGSETTMAYSPMFYPGVTDVSAATPLELSAGDDLRGIDLRLRKTTVTHVRGQVTGIVAPQQDAAAPAGRGGRGRGGFGAGAMVYLYPADTGNQTVLGGQRPGSVNPRDGTFEIRDVRPGAYTLIAMQNNRDAQAYARTMVAVSEAGLDNVALNLQPAFPLQGKITTKETTPPSGLNRVNVQLIPLEDLPFGTAGARTDQDGAFTVTIGEPTKYHVVAQNLPQGYYLKSARLGQVDVLEKGLDLSSGTALGELELVLSSGAGTVTGSVQTANGDAASGVTVAIVPQAPYNEWWELYRTTSTDQQGAFQLTGIRPGSYKVFAFEKLESGASQDPDFIKKFDSAGQSVRLAENGQESVQLKAVPAEDTAP